MFLKSFEEKLVFNNFKIYINDNYIWQTRNQLKQ